MNPLTTEPSNPAAVPPPTTPGALVVRDEEGRIWEIPPEAIPNIDDLIIEDGKPVDSIFMERQYRLLIDPLYSAWRPSGEDRPFMANANVGLFYQMGEPPLVPDVMLSLDVKPGDPSQKEDLSYLVWKIGKPPTVVIEIVSDRYGGEATHKLRTYARIGIPYYVIFDRQELLGEGVLRVLGLHEGAYEPVAGSWLSSVGLGLTFWAGTHEGMEAHWLRWCDQEGQIIPTGHELALQERQRAEQERQHVERLMEQLRAAGMEPSP